MARGLFFAQNRTWRRTKMARESTQIIERVGPCTPVLPGVPLGVPEPSGGVVAAPGVIFPGGLRHRRRRRTRDAEGGYDSVILSAQEDHIGVELQAVAWRQRQLACPIRFQHCQLLHDVTSVVLGSSSSSCGHLYGCLGLLRG